MKSLLLCLVLLSSPVHATPDRVCMDLPWACSTSPEGVSDTDHLSLVEMVNKQVNRSVRPITDKKQYGIEELWSLPTKRGGDCEDYALLKKKKLIEAGVSPHNLLLTVAYQPNVGGHAVLIYVLDRELYVLDNLTNKITKAEDSPYVFLKMQNPISPSEWVLAPK